MSTTAAPTGFAFASPHEAIDALIAELQPVDEVALPLRESFGRILSEAVYADRDSPPHDVSAMDGYAVSSSVLVKGGVVEIAAEIAIGQPPPTMPTSGCFKISTGACVPEGCVGVIPREQVEEEPDRITLKDGFAFKPGQHIRRRGENTHEGQVVVEQGTMSTPPVASALAAFGCESVKTYRKVRIAILTTGDELLPVEAKPESWQIRDSNTSTLLAGLSHVPWIEVVGVEHAEDERAKVSASLSTAAAQSDLILTTGGVSMGDHDYLKPALLDLGGKVVYHKLPIRPGKPGLAGLVPDQGSNGQYTPLLAMPGNPVAVAVAIPLFVGPIAHALAGLCRPDPKRLQVTISNPPTRTLGLWRYLPARLIDDGQAELLSTKGSGDLASTAPTDGYVQMPPNAQGPGPWVFYDACL